MCFKQLFKCTHRCTRQTCENLYVPNFKLNIARCLVSSHKHSRGSAWPDVFFLILYKSYGVQLGRTSYILQISLGTPLSALRDAPDISIVLMCAIIVVRISHSLLYIRPERNLNFNVGRFYCSYSHDTSQRRSQAYALYTRAHSM